jgi:RNA polymerase sigma-70 factor (ECF subfamily)
LLVDTTEAESLSPAAERALEDAILVRRFQGGDQAAFSEIVGRYREKMFSIGYSMLRNRDDAEEVAQDTFIRAYRGLASFRGEASLATWLHHITVNLARNRYWYFFRRCRHLSDSFDAVIVDDRGPMLSDVLVANAAGPAHQAMTGEFLKLIDGCLGRLSPRSRQILTLRTIQHRSYREISDDMSINVGTVKSCLARARQDLRLQMGAACPEFGEGAPLQEWFETSRFAGRT